MGPEEWAEKIRAVIEEARAENYAVVGYYCDGYVSLVIGYLHPEGDPDIFITDISE